MTVYELIKDFLLEKIDRGTLVKWYNELFESDCKRICIMDTFDEWFPNFSMQEIAEYFLNIECDDFSFGDSYWKEDETYGVFSFGEDKVEKFFEIDKMIGIIFEDGIYFENEDLRKILSRYDGYDIQHEVEEDTEIVNLIYTILADEEKALNKNERDLNALWMISRIKDRLKEEL